MATQPAPAPTIEPDVPGSTDPDSLPSVDPPDNEGLWHLGRYPFKHAFCGVECDPSQATSAGGGVGERCEPCWSIMRAHVEGRGWEGYGKRPPGKSITEYMRELLEK